ncbi:hypothetical protein JKG68_10815 [Microvirga aerilata]|uniref:Uncharacterized protein n=1 Tax=Microvirga aerilata TaxID=670292 RepID=A0A937D1S7_9HYPH|nr:hypothetical protein [Microvirga aerilata]MBL0404460.1 hypothetical protein [Microvirga aerilata]
MNTKILPADVRLEAHGIVERLTAPMLIAQQHAVTIFAVTFAYVSYVPWKVPEATFFSSRNCS